MMNAELTSQGLSKIIIPTVYREDYLGALQKLSRLQLGDAYTRMMLRAYEFSSMLNDDSIDSMERHLKACEAFETPKEGQLNILSKS